jgi:catechol 2,3-dioxygenase-like lactoylglutathione lyase family enzyme
MTPTALATRIASSLITGLVLFGLSSNALTAQDTPRRPKITGISHVGYFVSDLPKAVAFWHDFLGYDQAYTLPNKDGGVRISFIKVNDHQHIELFNEKSTVPNNFMSHLAFAVDDVEQMRIFLRSKGYEIKPGNGGKTKTGDYAFEIKDPNGMLIEFFQDLPGGMEMKAGGKFAPSTRISPSIYHVGYLVSDAQSTSDFYKMLGFTETWRGGANPKELSWINMKVPDGDDYVELMLYHNLPSGAFGTKNHISLVVPNIEKSVAILKTRPYFTSYGKELTINTGINQKRQVNMYDPDGTRVEIMEPTTITGKATLSSTAPPPAASTPWAK